MLKPKQNQWASYTTTQRSLTIIGYVLSIVAIISCIIGLFDIIDIKYTNFITFIFIGIMFLLSGIRDYHSDPKEAKQMFFASGISLFATTFNIILYVIRYLIINK